MLAGIPDSENVKDVLKWAMDKDKHVITLCHGPASLLAANVGEDEENYIYKGYEICVFPTYWTKELTLKLAICLDN